MRRTDRLNSENGRLISKPNPVYVVVTTGRRITMERLISDLEKHSGKAGRVSRQDTIVPKYDVLAVCNACGDAHPTGISINLAGPVKKRSIATAYRGKNLPRHLATLKQERVYCPNLGRHYPQTDYRQIFLVPSAERAANRGSSSYLPDTVRIAES